jgi:hypothetical protein
MAYFVNGQLVTEAVILEEQERIARDPRWAQLTDEAERAKRLRAAAEHTAIERTLVEQAANGGPATHRSECYREGSRENESGSGVSRRF